MHTDVIEKVERGIKRSVPLMGVATADPSEAAKEIVVIAESISKQIKADKAVQYAVLEWDCSLGLRGANERGKQVATSLVTGPPPAGGDGASLAPIGHDEPEENPFVLDPVGMLQALLGAPKYTIVMMHQAHRFLAEPMNTANPEQSRAAMQAIINLRDRFTTFRSLILLGQEMRLPIELQSDVQTFDDPLPGRDELRVVVKERHTFQGADGKEETIPLTKKHIESAVDWITGLSAFGARQAVTLSIPSNKEPCDLSALRHRRHSMIEQVPGLHVYPPEHTFEDVAGYPWAKQQFVRIFNGRRPIKLVVHIDELEKQFEGLGTESSGTTGDQLGVILNNMERYKHRGLIAYGPPGTGKTFLAETCGPTFDIDTIQLDLGAAKGMHVSESEAYIRRCLQTINAMGCGEVYWIAT